jgi:hypothetical protein
VLTWQGKLSLAHALIVVSLTTVSILPIHGVEPWQTTNPALFLGQQFRLSLYLFMSLSIFLKAPCFGSDPQCNLCVRIGLGPLTTHQTDEASRFLQLASSYLMAIFWLQDVWWIYGPWHYIQTIPAIFSSSHRHQWQKVARMTHNNLQQRRQRKGGCVTFIIRWYYDNTKAGENVRVSQRPQPRQYRNVSAWKTWLISLTRTAILVPRCQRALIALLLIGIWITYIEGSVQLNLSNKADDWSFGQMYAMIMCIQPTAQVIQLFANLKRHR